MWKGLCPYCTQKPMLGGLLVTSRTGRGSGFCLGWQLKEQPSVEQFNSTFEVCTIIFSSKNLIGLVYDPMPAPEG